MQNVRIVSTFLLFVGLMLFTFADQREVQVGPNFALRFVDAYSGNSITTIDVGDTVRWRWVSGSHTTTSRDNLWRSVMNSSNRTFDFTFRNRGTFGYFCEPHALCCGMTGEVHVRLRGDVDENGCINDRDLAAVLRDFGLTGARPSDVNYDRQVRESDVERVLEEFGNGC